MLQNKLVDKRSHKEIDFFLSCQMVPQPEVASAQGEQKNKGVQWQQLFGPSLCLIALPSSVSIAPVIEERRLPSVVTKITVGVLGGVPAASVWQGMDTKLLGKVLYKCIISSSFNYFQRQPQLVFGIKYVGCLMYEICYLMSVLRVPLNQGLWVKHITNRVVTFVSLKCPIHFHWSTSTKCHQWWKQIDYVLCS